MSDSETFIRVSVEVDSNNRLDEIAKYRGTAIQDYAILEHALCRLMAVFGKMNIQDAGIIFFKLTSASVRDNILDKLLRRNFGNSYSTYWNSLSDMIRKVSTTRNQVVHWIASEVSTDNGTEIRLAPGNLFAGFPQETMSIKELVAFCNFCRFLWNACRKFMIYLDPNMSLHWTEEKRKPWREIFQQSITYPVPDIHLLSPNYKEPESQTRPSPESPESAPDQFST